MFTLKDGDQIGVVAPSRPISFMKEQFEYGLDFLKNAGFTTILSKNINKEDGISAGAPQERADDINNFFADTNIKVIVAALGGSSANQILPLLDYELISKNPKPLLGFSDITNILLAIYSKSGLPAVYAPNLVNVNKLNEGAKIAYINILKGQIANKEIFKGVKVIKHGETIGELIGGNLMIICNLRSTPYSPDYKDKIIFFEEISDELGDAEYFLYQAKLNGILSEVRGIIIGNMEVKDKKGKIELLLKDWFKDTSIPIIKLETFGHNISNCYPIPIGANIKINTQKREYLIEG